MYIRANRKININKYRANFSCQKKNVAIVCLNDREESRLFVIYIKRTEFYFLNFICYFHISQFRKSRSKRGVLFTVPYFFP